MGLSRTVTNSPISRRFSEFRGDAPRQTLFPGISMQYPKQGQSVWLAKPIGLVCGRLVKVYLSTSSNRDCQGGSVAGFSKFGCSTDALLSATEGNGQ